MISVVIPVYKVELYLERCIKSVMCQSFKDIEIILVDDGSPDNCAAICDDYAKKDKRIIVIHKINGGLSDARNAGIDIAKGEYITFIDSDDWVSKDYIKNLYQAIKKDDADLAISQFKEIFEGNEENQIKGIKEQDRYILVNKEKALEKLFYQDYVEMSAWGKLYKTKSFKNIRYPIGKLYEDIPVTYAIMSNCDKIAIIENVDYYYFQRLESIQYQKFDKRKMDAIYHFREVMNKIYVDFPTLKPAVVCRYFSCLCNILFQINDNSDDEYRKILWSDIKKYRSEVLKNKQSRKKAKAAAIISYFGFFILKKVYKATQKRGGIEKKYEYE